MLTAAEARAYACLKTPKEFSLHKHIEIRIWDAIQNGGTYILYANEFSSGVIEALRSLGYTVQIIEHEGTTFLRISWDKLH